MGIENVQHPLISTTPREFSFEVKYSLVLKQEHFFCRA